MPNNFEDFNRNFKRKNEVVNFKEILNDNSITEF